MWFMALKIALKIKPEYAEFLNQVTTFLYH